MVELYHFWSSVCSVRVRMALEEKGVPWTSRYVDLFKFDQMKPRYLAVNPDGVVPTLVHDGNVVRESSIICEYIDDAFDGPPLIPPAALDAARMRLFVRACDEGLDPIAKLTMVKYIMPKLRNRWSEAELQTHAELRPTKFLKDLHSRAVRNEISNEELEHASMEISVLLDRLEATLAPGPWIAGGAISLADIAIAPFMFRLSALGASQFWSVDCRPRIHEWYGRLSSRAAFKTAVSWPDESGGGYEEVGLSAAR